MWIKYIGPEPRVSFAAASDWSEQGLEPFVDRGAPVEVSQEVLESRCFNTITVPDPQGVPQTVKRPSGEWVECDAADADLVSDFENPENGGGE